MGLYVKGESKPDVCESCWFHVRWNGFEDLQCGLNDGKIIAMNTHEYKGQTAIPDWCPLVEVPEPHGRLIDADALADDLDYDDKMFHDEIKANAASWLRSQVNITLIESEK